MEMEIIAAITYAVECISNIYKYTQAQFSFPQIRLVYESESN